MQETNLREGDAGRLFDETGSARYNLEIDQAQSPKLVNLDLLTITMNLKCISCSSSSPFSISFHQGFIQIFRLNYYFSSALGTRIRICKHIGKHHC